MQALVAHLEAQILLLAVAHDRAVKRASERTAERAP
jgi:hypothetical protein